MGGRIIADRYRLEEQVGAGGMGFVWRATDLELGRVVALKQSRWGDACQIRREARIGAGLHHPNVVTVFDVITDGGERWLVLEYLRSRSLAEILETDGPLPPGEVARIGVQLAGALVAMHAKGMAHRDITPGNVLVAENGTAKLTDLGIARWAEVTLTGSGMIGGTPGYLAPEVAMGQEAGTAADVFSLGATLFAAVEGVSPWGKAEETRPFGQVRRAADFALEPARKAGRLAPVLSQMLRRKPTDRATSDDAERLLAGYLDAVPVRPSRRPIAAVRRVLAVATALVLVSGLALASSTPQGAQPTADSIGEPEMADPCAAISATPFVGGVFDRASLEPAYGNFNGCSFLMAFSPGGRIEVRLDLEVPDVDQMYQTVRPEPGKLTVPDRPPAADGHCARTIPLPDGYLAVVTARYERARYPSLPLCMPADLMADSALSVLNRGQIPRRPHRFPPKSLANVDACRLLRYEDQSEILGGISSAGAGFGNWLCYSTRETRKLTIDFDRKRWALAPEIEVRHIKVGPYDAFVNTKTRWKGACQVEVVYQRSPDNDPDLYEVLNARVEDRDAAPESQCEAAERLAVLAAGRLPMS